MKFSDGNDPWRSVPEWASYLIEFGFGWLAQTRNTRRIAVVSMPSDSAAAGLIALGAMRKCLEVYDANDVSAHYDRLIELARRRPAGLTFRHNTLKGEFVFDGIDSDGTFWVKKVSPKGFRAQVLRRTALNWRVAGDPPVSVFNGEQVPYCQLYENLVAQGGSIRPANLSETHSQICLAGRGVGEAPTRKWMADIRFRDDICEANLSQLLTVQSWMPGTISRVMFYNARTEEFDRHVGSPQVVIADGDTSFLRVIDGKEFEDSDVVGVIHRTMERDRLEAVGTRLETLRQWYEVETSVIDGLPARPRGIGLSVLKRMRQCQ